MKNSIKLLLALSLVLCFVFVGCGGKEDLGDQKEDLVEQKEDLGDQFVSVAEDFVAASKAMEALEEKMEALEEKGDALEEEMAEAIYNGDMTEDEYYEIMDEIEEIASDM